MNVNVVFGSKFSKCPPTTGVRPDYTDTIKFCEASETWERMAAKAREWHRRQARTSSLPPLSWGEQSPPQPESGTTQPQP